MFEANLWIISEITAIPSDSIRGKVYFSHVIPVAYFCYAINSQLMLELILIP